MIKLLMLSSLMMMVALPIRAANTKSPMVGLRRAFWQVLLYNVFYWVAVVYLYFIVYLKRDPTDLLNSSVHQ
ncbi:MAG: hypothetical protein K1X64_06265 [Myxococcaceae bacterium]|nr:hypothetical protein [Myxococcaceae bacterium]